ncbi:MAG: hypothetical protein Q4D92_02810 [Slackia sp.]|nr:hypothetical protein [Slackia sp.]
MNISTAVVLAIVIACICLAIRSFRKKGMCGCKEQCSSECCASSCSSCAAADNMVKSMDEALKD